ncbi:MAG: putative Ig domain-containing protein [Kiritimatiellaeota bacterium]|nr:putative Ig domain-containing protein [Kiritimatiellota bacterium]
MSIGAVTSSFYCGGAAGINNGTFGDSYWKADGTAEFNSLAIGISYWSSATSNLFSVNAPPGQFAAPHPAYGTTSLLDALNGWVDATNAVLGAEVYRHWTLEGSPDGYPILDFTQSTYTEGGNWEDNRDTAWGAALSETLHIGTAEELAQFAWLVNTTGNDFFSGVTVVLTSDIDLSAHGWTPAGTNNPARIFHGTFDGQGHTIYGMTIHASNTVTYAGLFGTIGEGSMVCNVNLVDTDIAIYCDREDIRAGGIVGVNVRGTVANCRNSGTVSCLFSRPPYYTHCGGIVGYNAGRVKDCVNSAAVSAASTSSATIGGVVGLNDYRVVTENCQNRGAVSSACHQYTHCGGVVGWNRGVAANCWSSGNVTASVSNYTTYLGGVIGENGVLGFPSGNLARDSYWKADGTAGFNRAAAGVNYGYSSNLFSVNAPPGQFASSHPTYGTTSLLDALNGWVDATNAVLGAEVYRLWTLDGSPDGYPILFSEPPTPPYSYAVAFVSTALDGGGVMYNQPFTNGVAQNLNLNAFRFPCTALPVPTEFPFLGWAASAGGDVVFTDGQNVCDLTGTPDATVTLYTVWGSVTDDASGITANPDGSVVTGDGAVSSDGSMTVTLDPAGGVCETSVVCTDFTYNALPEDVDRPGYTFLGWVTRTGQPVVNGMRFLDANYAAALTAQWVSATAPEIAGVDAPPPTVGVTYLGQVVMRPSSMPSKLSAQKLPTGLKLNPSTGEITGVPKKVGIHTVTVRATSLSNRKAYTEQTFRMVVAPLPAGAIGTFDGYLDGTDDHGPVNLGSLTLTASASGKASAKVVAAASGAQSVSIPAWDSLSNGVLRATAVSAKGIPLTVALDTTAAFGSWQLTGAFGDTPALAQRNALKVKEDPHFAAAQEALAAHMGYYTVGIRGDCILDGHGPLLFPPRGFGYLSMTVGTKPSLKLAGRLADGKAFSGTCPIAFGAGNVLVPYFFPLYAAQGYHSGVLELTPALTASGEGRWVYPGLSPAAKVPLTADRFTLSILLAGGAYTPAAAALATYPQGPFFKAGPTDADYTYTKGKYSVTASPLPPPQDGVVMVGDKKGNLTLPTGTVPVYDPVASAYIFDHWNPAQATFNVTPATGLFKGKFNVYYEYPDEGGASRLKAIPVSYQGILTPLAGWGAGVGHSLLGDTRIDASGAKPVTYKLMRSEPVTLEVE